MDAEICGEEEKEEDTVEVEENTLEVEKSTFAVDTGNTFSWRKYFCSQYWKYFQVHQRSPEVAGKLCQHLVFRVRQLTSQWKREYKFYNKRALLDFSSLLR